MKSPSEYFDHIFSSLWEFLIWKTSPSVICYILGVLRNTLIANDIYPITDFVYLSSPIRMQLSLKATIFFDFSVLFLESTSNFKHLEKKDDRHSYFISEIIQCERLG